MSVARTSAHPQQHDGRPAATSGGGGGAGGAGATILVICPWMLERRPDRPIRGVQIHDLHVLRSLVALGHRPTILADPWWKPRLPELLGAAMPEVIWTPPLGQPAVNAIVGVLRLSAAKRRFDRLIITNDTRSMSAALPLLRATKICGRGAMIAAKRMPPRLVRALRRAPMDVACVNGQIAGEINQAVPGRAHVYFGIPNADEFHPPADLGLRHREPSAEKPLRIVILGKLDDEWKGADTVAEAIDSLSAGTQQRLELHLAGYADLDRAPKGDRVRAYRFMPASEMPEFLRTMDVMAVPSRAKETFSQVIVQGMLTGLPILSSEHPVLVEKLDAGGGIVCGAPADYAAAIERLLNDAALREDMGRAARRTGLERYVWSTDEYCRRFLGLASPDPEVNARGAPAREVVASARPGA